MSDDILIKCDHVSRKFCKDLKRSFWYGLNTIIGQFYNTFHSSLYVFHLKVGLSLKGNVEHHNRLRKDEFWAVHDVSFEVRRVECQKQKTRVQHQHKNRERKNQDDLSKNNIFSIFTVGVKS